MSDAAAPNVTAQALAWLDARPEPAPPELRQRMAEALAGVTAGTVPGALAEGALSCLQATMAAPQERATALDLLAADALLTYALEAAAEIGVAAIKEMTATYGADALAGLLPEHGPLAPGEAKPLAGDTGTRRHGDAASEDAENTASTVTPEDAQNADAPTRRGSDAPVPRADQNAQEDAADRPDPSSEDA